MTGEKIAADLVKVTAELMKWESYRSHKIKLGNQYGDELAGHWFYIVPADEFAEKALISHKE